jgi:cob(I)alamin adenosyltransferase
MMTARNQRPQRMGREDTMVVLNKIYTRAGDDGTTALGTGERRKKYDARISAYGTLDELNAVVGVARLHTAGHPEIHTALARIQNDLFDAGADLCMPGVTGKGPGGARLAVSEAQVEWLEQQIDALNENLQPLRSFILSGGSAAAAHLHLARTVCRRAERLIAELRDTPGEVVSIVVLKFVNRLSDFLFVAARAMNDNGASDVLWVPGQNR